MKLFNSTSLPREVRDILINTNVFIGFIAGIVLTCLLLYKFDKIEDKLNDNEEIYQYLSKSSIFFYKNMITTYVLSFTLLGVIMYFIFKLSITLVVNFPNIKIYLIENKYIAIIISLFISISLIIDFSRYKKIDMIIERRNKRKNRMIESKENMDGENI